MRLIKGNNRGKHIANDRKSLMVSPLLIILITYLLLQLSYQQITAQLQIQTLPNSSSDLDLGAVINSTSGSSGHSSPRPDPIIGSFGDDRISGTNSTDIIIGLLGSDTIRGEEEGDIIQGSEDLDRLYGDGGDDMLQGGQGSDQLYGGEGDDILVGGIGDDLLRGENGSDKLYGAVEDDILQGGQGADYFDCGEGIDIIIDFNMQEGDDNAGNCEEIFSSGNG